MSFGIFVALLVDAIVDPWIGYISDHWHSRWGRRHPLMYASGLPVALVYYFLWSPPQLGPEAMVAYFVSLAILIRILISFYEIPSTALVAELTDDYDQRTQFMSFRFFFGWWGGLTMAVLVYLFFLPESLGGLEYRAGWSHYGLAASIIIFVSIYVSSLGTHKHIPYLKQPPARTRKGFVPMLSEFKDTLSNRSFLMLFLSALFTAVAAGIGTSLSIYFTRHFWELTSTQIGLHAIAVLRVCRNRAGARAARVAQDRQETRGDHRDVAVGADVTAAVHPAHARLVSGQRHTGPVSADRRVQLDRSDVHHRVGNSGRVP